MSAHVASENVAFDTIDSSARSKTVPLNAAHTMPEMPTETAVTGVRVGASVGATESVGTSDIVGAGDGGTLIVGAGVGAAVVGSGVGAGVGKVVGAGVGAGVGADVGIAVGTSVETETHSTNADAIERVGSGVGAAVVVGAADAVGTPVGATDMVGANEIVGAGDEVGAGVGYELQYVSVHPLPHDTSQHSLSTGPSCRIAKCTIAAVKLPSETAASSSSVKYALVEPWPRRSASASGSIISLLTVMSLDMYDSES